MKPEKIKRKVELADGLDNIIKVFQPKALDEEDFDAFYYADTMAIRTGSELISPLDDLFEDCKLSFSTNAHLLSGHRGCGKSAELMKLKRRFEESGHPVCRIDCLSEMNLNKAGCWDIILFISEGLCRIADEKKIDLPDDLVEGMFNYILQDVETTEEFTSAKNINIGLTLSLIASIKAGLQMGDTQRETIKMKMQKRGSDWKRYIDEIYAFITDAMEGNQPILIFEDLDKLPTTSPDAAIEIFSYDMLAKMPFPVIYTFPISEMYSTKVSTLGGLYKHCVLPMIKVRDVNKVEDTEGIKAIREIVGKRADLGFFGDKALHSLITQTGGVLRHLFECIQFACRIALRRGSSTIELCDAEMAIERLASKFTTPISMNDNAALARIYSNIDYRKQIEETPTMLRYLEGLLVLEYQNGTTWRDLHPYVEAFLLNRGIVE